MRPNGLLNLPILQSTFVLELDREGWGEGSKSSRLLEVVVTVQKLFSVRCCLVALNWVCPAP